MVNKCERCDTLYLNLDKDSAANISDICAKSSQLCIYNDGTQLWV